MGDALAKHLPRYGRPSVNQFSIAVTAPLVAIYFKGLPGLPSPPSSSLMLAGHTTFCFMACTVLSWQLTNPVIHAMLCSSRCLSQSAYGPRLLQSFPAILHVAGAQHFSNGVPDHMHKYMALYSVVLFLVAIAAPMEQSNNAAMYAEVSQSDGPLPAFLSHSSCGLLSESCDRKHLVQQVCVSCHCGQSSVQSS